jgi:hypothetical protein
MMAPNGSMRDKRRVMPSSKTYIQANPYPWPYDGDLHPHNTAH